jgi:hypothetical protein
MSRGIDLEQANHFELDGSEASWYDLWHTHVDWDGDGNDSSETRAAALRALFIMFERAISQTKTWTKPANVWVLFVPSNAEADSLYVHTPNPNGNTPFPYHFEGVEWGVAPPAELQPFIGVTHEVGVSEYNETMFWVRERNAS